MGAGGHPESGTPSNVWSRALVWWSTLISKSSFTKKIRVNPPPPLLSKLKGRGDLVNANKKNNEGAVLMISMLSTSRLVWSVMYLLYLKSFKYKFRPLVLQKSVEDGKVGGLNSGSDDQDLRGGENLKVPLATYISKDGHGVNKPNVT